MSRRKILLTEGSSVSARHTLYGLGSDYVVDVMDPNPLCQCRFSWLVRKWHQCPSYWKQPVEYLKFLADLLDEEHYDVLLPTHEQVMLLGRVRDALSRRVGLAIPEFTALERMQNKAEFARLLDELKLPYPATEVLRSRQQLEQHGDYPCYVKLSHSTAGRGVHLVRNSAEMRRLAVQLEQAGQFHGSSETLVQHPAKGTHSTVQAVFQHGRLVGSHIFEATANGVGGSAMARVSASHPIVLEHVQRIGAHLDWHGALFIEYFFDSNTQQPEYIECNPRIGETVNAMLSGVNLCRLLVQVSLDEHVDAAPPSKIGVHSHMGFMILMASALSGGGRLELLKTWLRYRSRQGFYRNSAEELTCPRADWLSLVPHTAVTLALLTRPSFVNSLINCTVNNYSLPAEQMDTIRNLSVCPTLVL